MHYLRREGPMLSEAMQYQTFRSVSDVHVFVLCYERVSSLDDCAHDQQIAGLLAD